MVSTKEVSSTFTFKEAVVRCRWPVAERYFVYNGKIWPDSGMALRKWTAPLSDPNLFLSLAKLGARGDVLPENAALSWVRRRGLFDRQAGGTNEPRTSDGEINQQPLPVAEFQWEARLAHSALTLLQDLRLRRIGALRARIGSERYTDSRNPGTGEWERLTLDEIPVPGSDERLFGTGRTLPELTDNRVLSMAWHALGQVVQERLRGVEPVFVPDFVGSQVPRLSFCAPDLRTAVWLQVASIIDRRRPMRDCQVCGQAFPLTRSDKVTCDGRCRKRKSLRSRGG